ncbi:protein amalgam [Dendroctonus ponderosae]|uniref:protein amalgam n=1 Tax=Dendroctonus ponderosae TaxID=77166 RepID=UPI002034D267|nr:protein amalgam [Dendroctonus ponderosae]
MGKCANILVRLIVWACFLTGCTFGSDLENSKDLYLYHTHQRGPRSYVSKDYSSNGLLKGVESGKVFLTPNSTTIVAQIGGTAKLPCVVRKFNNGVVSWIRKNDLPPTILTVGLGTYIADDRFLVEHVRHLQNWGLVIKHVQISDAGTYECQVSLHPTTSIFIDLKVIEAIAEISGAPDLHIRAGSRLRIVCRLRHSTEPPAYVFWYHDHRMINHDPGVRVTIDRSTSILRIEDVDPSFSGNYTCYPANAIPSYVNVHVLNATDDQDHHETIRVLKPGNKGFWNNLFPGYSQFW